MDLLARSADDVAATSVEWLGFDPGLYNLASTEVIAEGLRVAARALSPCTPRTLQSAVLRGLRGHLDPEAADDLVQDVYDELLTYGDLHEHAVAQQTGTLSRRTLTYAAPPQLVPRDDGSHYIVGVFSDRLPQDVLQHLERKGAVRRLAPDLVDVEPLLAAGARLATMESWLTPPPVQPAHRVLAEAVEVLQKASAASSSTEIVVIDPARPVTYYRGRWRTSAKQTGLRVGRRSQAYGADLWCFAELDRGTVTRLVDLPIHDPLQRGADVAWRLQAAIDATEGHPQQVRRRLTPAGVVLDVFSPLPSWLYRRWSIVGEWLPRSQGSLFSAQFRPGDVDAELAFLKSSMWLTEVA